MKEQIFRLCKRLKNCTLNDLVQMLEVDEAIIETALLFLEQEESISIKDGVISINDAPKQKSNIEQKNLFLMKGYISDEKFEIILKSFCLEIPPQKTAVIVEVHPNRICNYYGVFRRLIYEKIKYKQKSNSNNYHCISSNNKFNCFHISNCKR